ncbi:DUF2791 family P-loop domain-containing protein [Lentzea alba]|uniref:ATP-binding protein n=1 Tax=Lentzea alba TaxID=2714351 RepID=UPI0039BF4A96
MSNGALTTAGAQVQPLVGRTAELAALHGQLHEVARGHGGVALVIGEAGSGKSSLLRSVADYAHDHDIRLVWAAGDELSQAFPLLPLVDAVEGAKQAVIAGLLRGKDADGVHIVDPVLAASDQLIDWIDDLCSTTPVVLVLDDLHWADSASIRLWHRLTRKAEQLPLLVVGAMRPGYDRQELAALRRRVAALREVGLGMQFELEPLASDAVTELVAELVGGTPSRRLSQLAARAGGNPLYLTELIGALAREGSLTQDDDGHVDATFENAPASLSAAIADRLDQVPPHVQEVLSLAALLGVEFSVGNLATVAGRTVAELVGMLGRAQSAGVLKTVHGGMAFRHPLIRDALCEQVPASVRAALHVEMGRALALAAQPATAVARQLVAAIDISAELASADWLTDWLVTEGPTLVNQSVSVAKTLFAEALHHTSLADPRRFDISVLLASALFRAGEFEAGERVATQALTTIDTRRIDDDLLLDAYTALADVVLSLGKFDAMLILADEARSLRDWSIRHLVRIDVLRARAMGKFRETEAESLAIDCLAQAREVGVPWAIGSACNMLAFLRIVHYDPDAGMEYLNLGIAAVEGDPALYDLYLCLMANRAYAYYLMGSFDDLASAVFQVRQLAERVGNRRRMMQAELFESCRLFETGEWQDYSVHLEASDIVDLREPLVLIDAAAAALHCDDMEKADRYTKLAESAAEAAAGASIADNIFIIRALWLEYQGKPIEALDELMKGVRKWDAAYWPVADAVRLAVACDRKADAKVAVAFAEVTPYKKTLPGLALLCRGLLDRDPAALEQAAHFLRERQLRPRLAMTLEALGLVWVEHGNTGKARAALNEALDLYEKMGAAWDIRRARATFRAHGVRAGSRAARKRPATGWNSLTESETIVANLVAQGLSNPQIGEQLFLSRRTIETHVSHILAKLSLRGRVDIARIVNHRP